MKIKGDTVIFNSKMPCFRKERLGLKPNTVREISDEVEIKIWQKFFTEWGAGVTKYIKIRNYSSTMFGFTRRITDITPFKELVVISWNPNEVEA